MVKPWVAEFEKTLRIVPLLLFSTRSTETRLPGTGPDMAVFSTFIGRLVSIVSVPVTVPGPAAPRLDSGVALGSKVKFTS